MNNGLHEHLQIFVAIAEAGSLTAASIATGVGQATISRQLSALEEHLGCRLFQRSTRAIALTEQGEIYLRHARRMLELNEEAEAALQENGARLRGRLRVACSNGFGRKILIPALGQWQARYPLVRVELKLGDELAQLVEDRVDVAFRTAPLQESSLVARPIGKSRRIVVASRRYLKRHGSVQEPAQLANHQCIVFAGAARPGEWTFMGPKGEETVQVQGRLVTTTVDSLQEAVRADLGIAMMPAWFWQSGELGADIVELLTDYSLPEQTINALTSARRSSGKVRLFVDHVQQALRQMR